MAMLRKLSTLAIVVLSALVMPLEIGGIHLPVHRPDPPITPPQAATSSAPRVPQAAASGTQAPGGVSVAGTTTAVGRAYGAISLGGRAAGAP